MAARKARHLPSYGRRKKGQTIWSGPVAVKAGQRVIVDLNHNGQTTTKDFKQGLTMGPQPRFDVGIASAAVPIAPPTAQLSASQTQDELWPVSHVELEVHGCGGYFHHQHRKCAS